MNDPILMYGDEPIGQLYKNSKAQSTSIARVVTNPLTGDGISQGSGFMLDGKRCVALVNIATGTTMVEHTHYEYESVEEKVGNKLDKTWKLFGHFELTNNATGDWNGVQGATLEDASEVLFYISLSAAGGSPRNSLTCPINVLAAQGVFYDFYITARSYFFIGKPASNTKLTISQTNINIGTSKVFVSAYYR